jgi:hypothetical protein
MVLWYDRPQYERLKGAFGAQAMGGKGLLLDQRSQIPVRFEQAIHAVIERTRELNKITLAVIYGQLPWDGDAVENEDAEVQLALILDDDVTDFVATKLELTKTAYDVLIETGIEVAPFPVPVTHWYLPSKAANPSLIEEIRKHGLRINLDRIVPRAVRPQVEARPVGEILSLLQGIHNDLAREWDLQAMYFVPQLGSTRIEQPQLECQEDELETGPIDVLVDFGGRPSTERVLGVQQTIESTLQMPIQLLTTSSIRKALLDLLLTKALLVRPQGKAKSTGLKRQTSAIAGRLDDD